MRLATIMLAGLAALSMAKPIVDRSYDPRLTADEVIAFRLNTTSQHDARDLTLFSREGRRPALTLGTSFTTCFGVVWETSKLTFFRMASLLADSDVDNMALGVSIDRLQSGGEGRPGDGFTRTGISTLANGVSAEWTFTTYWSPDGNNAEGMLNSIAGDLVGSALQALSEQRATGMVVNLIDQLSGTIVAVIDIVMMTSRAE